MYDIREKLKDLIRRREQEPLNMASVDYYFAEIESHLLAAGELTHSLRKMLHSSSKPKSE